MWTWAARILGGLNIVATLFGIYFFAWMIETHWRRWPGNASRFDWCVFYALSLLSVFLVFYLGCLGIKLLVKPAAATLKRLCLVSVLEIAYFWIDTFATWNMMPISRLKISVGFWGIAIAPLAPHIVIGLPLISLIFAGVLLLARRRSVLGAQNPVG